MVLNKKGGGVEEKRGFHRIHRRLEGQITLEIDKNQQGLGLACHPGEDTGSLGTLHSELLF